MIFPLYIGIRIIIYIYILLIPLIRIQSIPLYINCNVFSLLSTLFILSIIYYLYDLYQTCLYLHIPTIPQIPLTIIHILYDSMYSNLLNLINQHGLASVVIDILGNQHIIIRWPIYENIYSHYLHFYIIYSHCLQSQYIIYSHIIYIIIISSHYLYPIPTIYIIYMIYLCCIIYMIFLYCIICMIYLYLEHPKENNYSTKRLLLIFCLFLTFYSTRTVFIDLERFLTYLVPFAYMVHKTLFICMKSPEIAA